MKAYETSTGDEVDDHASVDGKVSTYSFNQNKVLPRSTMVYLMT